MTNSKLVVRCTINARMAVAINVMARTSKTSRETRLSFMAICQTIADPQFGLDITRRSLGFAEFLSEAPNMRVYRSVEAVEVLS